MLPHQNMQYLFNHFSDNIWDDLQKYNLDIDVQHHSVNKDIVEKAHSLGIKINCWIVDDPVRAQALVDMGVDFLTTDIIE